MRNEKNRRSRLPALAGPVRGLHQARTGNGGIDMRAPSAKVAITFSEVEEVWKSKPAASRVYPPAVPARPADARKKLFGFAKTTL